MKFAIPLFALVVAIAAIVWFTRAPNEHAGTLEIVTERTRSAPALRASTSDTAAAPSAAPSAAPHATTDAASPPPTARPTTPRALVEAQIHALNAGDDAAFRATFLPNLTVTDREIATCKRVVRERTITPDWSRAEATRVEGHVVTNVVLLGRARTGFHEVDGGIFADAAWCAPPGEAR